VAVVHNGVIENYTHLKSQLHRDGVSIKGSPNWRSRGVLLPRSRCPSLPVAVSYVYCPCRGDV
jgi:hypothetical protein